MRRLLWRVLCPALLLGVFVWPLDLALSQSAPETKQIVAKKFEFTPNEIVLLKGKAVVLELTSLDRTHGFNCPGLGLRSNVEPGKKLRLEFTPSEAGTFPFFCDVFCGSGHEEMAGVIIVKE